MTQSSNDKAPAILLIGASRGLGYAMAARCLKRGWDVAGTVNDRQDETIARGSTVAFVSIMVTNAPFGIEEAIPDIVDTPLSKRGRPGLEYLDRLGRATPW